MRWIEDGEEKSECWEITIDGDVMRWTAQREDENGNTFTASFEMNRVEMNTSSAINEKTVQFEP